MRGHGLNRITESARMKAEFEFENFSPSPRPLILQGRLETREFLKKIEAVRRKNSVHSDLRESPGPASADAIARRWAVACRCWPC